MVSGNSALNRSGGLDITPRPQPPLLFHPHLGRALGLPLGPSPAVNTGHPGRSSPDLLVSNDFAIFSPVN